MRWDLTYARLDSTSKDLENSENSDKLRNLKFYESFRVFQCLVQSEVKKIILVKSSLRKVRFNSCEVTLREDVEHQCDYLLLNIITAPKVIFLHLFVILFTGGVCLSACWDTPRHLP